MDISFNSGCITGVVFRESSLAQAVMESLYGIRPYDGKVLIDGKEAEITSVNAAIAYGIAVLNGNIKENLFCNMSVLENLKFIAYQRTYGLLGFNRERRVEYMVKHALSMFPISSDVLEARSINELPDSELMRLSIAKWLIIGARIIVILYPYSYLDESHRLELNMLLQRIKQYNITVIMLFVLTTDVENTCDEVIIC